MILLFVILVCAAGFVLQHFYIKRLVWKQWPKVESKAILVSRDRYSQLSLPERYAFIYVLDAYKDNILGSVRLLAIAIHQIELEAEALGVKVKDAEKFMEAKGIEKEVEYSISLVAGIMKKDKQIVDFLVYRCHELVEKASGRDELETMRLKAISKSVFLKMFTSLGYSEMELNRIVNQPGDLLVSFGRTYTVDSIQL